MLHLDDNGLAAHDGRRAIEKAMEESGMEYVVIRSMVFMDNLTRFWSKPSITNNDTFAYPCSPELKISWVCLEDVAKFMVASLSSSSLKADKIYVGGTGNFTRKRSCREDFLKHLVVKFNLRVWSHKTLLVQ